jgi:hypothetical protein
VPYFAKTLARPQLQGDQIGLIIAYWAIIFFGQVLEN